MTIKNYYQEVQEEFPSISYTYFIKLFNDAQLKFVTDTGVLIKGAALTDLDLAKSFTLPTDFIRLKRVDYLNASNEVIYEPLLHYCGQGTITFDSPTSTITSIPGEIANIVLIYVHTPVTLTDSDIGPVQTISVPTQFIDGVMALVRRKLHERYGTITRQGQDGSTVTQKDWTAVKFYTDVYNDEVRKGIKYINSIDTSALTIRTIDSAADIPQYVVNPVSGTITNNILMAYGTTAQRPTLTTSDVGYMYFDTDIQSAVWWNGSAWDDE